MRDGTGTQALCMQYPLGSSLGEGADILHMRKARQWCTRSHKKAAGVLQPRTPSLQSLCSLQTEEEEDPRQAGEMWTGGWGVVLTQHPEHDWSRGGGPTGELSPAVVRPSLGAGHVGEGKGGHRLHM